MEGVRIDVVWEGSSWTIAMGGPSWRGHLSRQAAVEAAVQIARGREADGHSVQVFIWDGDTPTKLYPPAPAVV